MRATLAGAGAREAGRPGNPGRPVGPVGDGPGRPGRRPARPSRPRRGRGRRRHRPEAPGSFPGPLGVPSRMSWVGCPGRRPRDGPRPGGTRTGGRARSGRPAYPVRKGGLSATIPGYRVSCRRNLHDCAGCCTLESVLAKSRQCGLAHGSDRVQEADAKLLDPAHVGDLVQGRCDGIGKLL